LDWAGVREGRRAVARRRGKERESRESIVEHVWFCSGSLRLSW
jgi:hypothetical protein